MKINNEKLIKLVKQYPILYNFNDKYYSDSEKKDEVWRSIGRQMNVSGPECKKSWSLLRDSFRRALKKMNDREPGLLRRKWRYEDEMAFVLPYFKMRQPVTNVKDEPIDSDEPLQFEEDLDITYTPLQSPDNNSVTSRESPDLDQINKRRKVEETEDTSNIDSSVKFVTDNIAKPKSNIEMFFDCMASTVNKFPLKQQVLAKKKVFEVISAMEMELLNEDCKNNGEQ